MLGHEIFYIQSGLGSSSDPVVHILVIAHKLLVNKRFRLLIRLSSSNGVHARKLDDVATLGSETSGLEQQSRNQSLTQPQIAQMGTDVVVDS